MTRIPPTALLLSIAGLIPFILGALLSIGILNSGPDGYALLIGSDGPLIMLRYGLIALCFLAGSLWGYASNATGLRSASTYALSVLPPLWVFLRPGANADEALINLMIGFAGVLLLDYAFHRWELAPPWWMALRVPLILVVLACLAIGAFA